MSTEKYSFPNSLFNVPGWDALITNFAELAGIHIHTRNQLILGETVAEYDALYLATDGKWYKAKADRVRQPAWYLALQDGILNDEILGQRVGSITNPAWSFLVGRPIYLSTTVAGEVTQLVPPHDRRQYIGIALTMTSMLMNGSVAGIGAFATTTSTTTTSSTHSTTSSTSSTTTSTTTTSTSSTYSTTSTASTVSTTSTTTTTTTSSTYSTTSTASTVSTTSSTTTSTSSTYSTTSTASTVSTTSTTTTTVEPIP